MGSTIHFIMQGKGGAGKSLVAGLFHQYLTDEGKTVFGFDTDPVNQTFQAFEGLNVQFIPIMENDVINSRFFDNLIEAILKITEEDAHIIIDSGASSFIPMAAYMLEGDIINYLEGQGHRVIIHSVVIGGQGAKETFNGFIDLAENFKDAHFVVWQNHWFGKVEHEGVSLVNSKPYEACVDRVLGIINVKKFREETFGHDFSAILANHETFSEAINDEKYTVMARSRLSQIRRQIFNEIKDVGIIEEVEVT